MRDVLSLCMIVRNEERNLPRCLDSVRDVAGELIVVDTGSVDATSRIAASYGAEVIPFDFTFVDFAAARNQAIARATRPWILVLDADETVERVSIPMIERLVAVNENSGYFLERHNHASDSSNSTRDYVVRLFPNRPNYRYRGRVHETIDASILAAGGRLQKTGIRIDHNFASNREERRRREPLVYPDPQGRDRRRPERRLAARFSCRGISPARNVRCSRRNCRTNRALEAARSPGAFVCGNLSFVVPARSGPGARRF